jgi:hypothetical protein
MPGLLTPAERDRARGLTTVLTGVLAAGSVAAVGALSAVAAEQTRQARETREAQARERTAAVLDAATQARHGALLANAAGHPQVVLVPRPPPWSWPPSSRARGRDMRPAPPEALP